jgi:hypothetical protein
MELLYLELAAREAESARGARVRSEAAERFALRQVDEGLCEHFLRVARREEMDAVRHAMRARSLEQLASNCRASAAAADGPPEQGPTRASTPDCDRAIAKASAEVVTQVLALCLRDDFEVALEHLPARTAERRAKARKLDWRSILRGTVKA